MDDMEFVKKLSKDIVHDFFLKEDYEKILPYFSRRFTCVGNGSHPLYMNKNEFMHLLKSVNTTNKWLIMEECYEGLDEVDEFACVVVTLILKGLNTYKEIKTIMTILWKKEEGMWKLSHLHDSFLMSISSELQYGFHQNEKMEEKMSRLGTIDILTQIANIQGFEEDVNYLFNKESIEEYVMITIGIRGFRSVNRKFGYQVGDEILKKIACCLQANIQENEACARVEKDIFSLLIKSVNKEVLKSRLEALGASFKSSNHEVNLHFKVGIYTIRPMDSVKDCIDKALLAMNSVSNKLIGNAHAYYVDKLTSIQYIKSTILEEALKAIEEDEFALYIQPQFDVKTKRIIAGEALVRWKRQDEIYRMPNDFIPLFEEYGVILNFDFYMLDKICKQVRKWMDDGVIISPISINQSRLHIEELNYFNDFVSVVDKYRIPHHYFAFELTESAFVENVVKMTELAKKLHKSGFQLAIDDFGTGYASLNLLSVISADILKIDKELIQDYQSNSKTKIIIEKIIEMAHEMDMLVVCEGVETKQQLEFLKCAHCDIVQGFLLGRPIAAEAFAKRWLNEKKGR